MRPLFFDSWVGKRASFVFPGHSTAEEDDEENENDLHFNANDAQYFFWGNALLWRPFVDQNELRNLHSNPSIDLCNSKKRNTHLWLTGDTPNFVSWCSMQWVHPSSSSDHHKNNDDNPIASSSCQLLPTNCETPVFQRTETIAITTAFPSLRYDVDSFGNEHGSNAESFVKSIPRPRSTQDLLLPPASYHHQLHDDDEKKKHQEQSSSATTIGMEVRVAFSLESPGTSSDIREGDLLAFGSHFTDSNGENEINFKSASSFDSSETVKFCFLEWNLNVLSENRLSLCAAPRVEDAEHNLPRSNDDICLAEMRRMRKAVFAIHHTNNNRHQSSSSVDTILKKISKVKLTTTRARGGDDVETGVAGGVGIFKTNANAESIVWEVPMMSAESGDKDGFQKIEGGHGEWCVIMS